MRIKRADSGEFVILPQTSDEAFLLSQLIETGKPGSLSMSEYCQATRSLPSDRDQSTASLE